MLYITATTTSGDFHEYWVDEGEESNALELLDNLIR